TDAQGYKLAQAVIRNPDGSTTIDTKAARADGSLANETITVTSADGTTRTVSVDVDGVIDRIRTAVTSTEADGTVGEIVANYRGASLVSAYLLDRTVTTTTWDVGGKTVSIERDTDGDGLFDQTETQVTSDPGP
ncbi:MAG: hypothetical protein HC834_02730, partial [Rhodospirillales bacterium]|nr:hypothetical protein [Rhodospirillales bacterium]